MKATFTIMARYYGEPHDQSGFTMTLDAFVPTIPSPGTRFAFVGAAEGERHYVAATDVVFSVPDQALMIELSSNDFPNPDALFAFASANGGKISRWEIVPEAGRDDDTEA